MWIYTLAVHDPARYHALAKRVEAQACSTAILPRGEQVWLEIEGNTHLCTIMDRKWTAREVESCGKISYAPKHQGL